MDASAPAPVEQATPAAGAAGVVDAKAKAVARQQRYCERNTKPCEHPGCKNRVKYTSRWCRAHFGRYVVQPKPEDCEKKGRPFAEDKQPGLKVQVPQTLVEQRGNLTKTGQELGISRETVRAILKRQPESWEIAKKAIAQQALMNSDRLAAALTDDKVDKMSGLQLVIGAKVAGQHALEMLGQAPAQVQVNIGLVQDSQGSLAAIAAELRRRQQADPASVAVNVTPAGTDATTGLAGPTAGA